VNFSHSSRRPLRVADYLQQELARLLCCKSQDPRFCTVSILHVKVSRDLGHARVWIGFLPVAKEGPSPSADEILLALNRAAGYLRSELARSCPMKRIPRLRFVLDESGARGDRLTALIDEALARDRRRPPPALS